MFYQIRKYIFSRLTLISHNSEMALNYLCLQRESSAGSPESLEMQRWFIHVLSHSPLLLKTVPEVRRLALIETVYGIHSKSFLRQLFVETLATSSYLPTDAKSQLAAHIFDERYDLVSRLLQCSLVPTELLNFDPVADIVLNTDFLRFRAMVIAVFSSSQRLTVVSEQRRRMLGSAIHEATTREQLLEITLQAIQTSDVMPEVVIY